MFEKRGALFFSFALPLVFAAATVGLGHAGDQEFFHRWYLAMREGGAFYRDGPGINYPIVGAAIVGLPAILVDRFTGPLDLTAYQWVLKITLGLFDVAFVFAAARLAKQLEIPRPREFALTLYALPASWAPGTFFGQIDGATTALMLITTSELIAYRRQGSWRHLALSLVSLIALVLCKQLAWFSLPALLLLLALGLWRHRQPGHIAIAALAPLLLFAPDPFLELPDGFHSHLHFVFSASRHGDLLVASGTSIWALLDANGADAHRVRLLGISAYVWAWGLYTIAQLAALRHVLAARASDRAIVEWQGLLHAGMAILLTGVHERYLVHALALMWIALAPAPRWLRGATALLGTWWAIFVLATCAWHWFDPVSFLRLAKPLAAAELIWLVVLIARRDLQRSSG